MHNQQHFKTQCGKRPTWRSQLVHPLHATVAWGRSCIIHCNASLVASDVWHTNFFFFFFTSGGGGQSQGSSVLQHVFSFLAYIFMCLMIYYNNKVAELIACAAFSFYLSTASRMCVRVCVLRLSPCAFGGVLHL